MSKVYISGPISAPDMQTVLKNLEMFDKAEAKLEKFYEVVNPRKVRACEDNSCGSDLPDIDGGYQHTWQCYLKHDLLAMLDCTKIALLPGWSNSKGATLEYMVAEKLEYEIINLDENGDIDDGL